MTRKRLGWGTLLFTPSLLVTACVGPPLILVPTELPTAVEGQRYSQSLDTADGDADRWEVSDGSLPSGLTLDDETGVLSGRPTTSGTQTYTFTISAMDNDIPSRSGEQTYSLRVIEELKLSASYDEGRVGESYDDTPTISGGVEPYEVQVSNLIGGLAFSATTGRIYGTPLQVYDGRELTITVTDSGNPQQTVSRIATLVIHPVGVQITTESLANAAIGKAYSASTATTGGLAPFNWAVVDGVLPRGLRLDEEDGVISGTPTQQAQTETFTIQVTDADSLESSDTQELTIVVPVEILTQALDNATIATEYEEFVTAIGGLPPRTWSIEGTLPAGLTLDAETGRISGTTTDAATTQTFTVTVADADDPAQTASQELTITVTGG